MPYEIIPQTTASEPMCVYLFSGIRDMTNCEKTREGETAHQYKKVGPTKVDILIPGRAKIGLTR